MATLNELLAEVCSGLPAEAASQIKGSGALMIDGVPVSFLSPGPIDPGGLHVYCELGPVPDGPGRADALARLLELNLELFRRDAPMFSFHPQSTSAVLMMRLEVQPLTVDAFRAMLADMVAMARAWQTTGFADGAAVGGGGAVNPFSAGVGASSTMRKS